MARPSVAHTTDFDRIVELPRRVPTDEDAEAWAAVLSADLREPGAIATLRPWQAYALAEAAANDGAWLALPVGLGKTLISALLPVLLDAKRPLLIVPASLEDKTWADFSAFRGTWKTSRNPFVAKSWQWLCTDSAQNYFASYQPDLIVIDEADDLSNPSSAVAARIDRYVIAHPDVRVVAMTGTPGRTSIMNYWHILCWCLKERAPVPMREAEAQMWAAAIDHKVREPSNRPRPGPLGDDIRSAREWYRARLLETPGVVIVDGDSCNAPLTVRTVLAREDSVLDDVFATFLKDFEVPGGECVSDPLSRWRLDGQLGCGLYSRYVVPPPDEWLAARRALAKFVRDMIARSQRSSKPLDTEGQVLRRYAEHPIVECWRALRDTFIPQMETVWISTSTVESALDWLRASSEPGIVWCGSVDFGEALARASGLEYYGRKGTSATGLRLHEAPQGRSMICSWNANKKGFNLQAWGRMLLVMPPQSAKWLEQIFGRAHRQGRDDEVFADILLTSGGTVDAFEAAIAEAGFGRETFALTQKILRAKVMRAKPKITQSNRFRWASRTKVEQ